MKKLLALLSIAVFLSCNNKPTSDWVALDLLKHGLPITIQAPLDPEIEKQDMGVWTDITVKSGEDYYVQLICADASTLDVAKVKADQLKEVQNGPFFSKIIEDKPDGFIFEKKVTEDRTNYDFRYIKIMGDKEYVFQTGLIGKYSEEAVKKMYEAVQQ